MNRKKKYAVAKHHAWAGSVLLAVLLAVRLFVETSDREINNTVFIALGVILIFYILVSLCFTFKYQKGLVEQDHTVVSRHKTSDDVKNVPSKDQLKIEKKKAKAEAKTLKKRKKK